MDKVTYDSVTTWGDKHPYRSSVLYAKDERASMSLPIGAPVQVILKHGDEFWTDAVKINWDTLDSGEIVRFYVRLADGTEHMVSADRIRPKA